METFQKVVGIIYRIVKVFVVLIVFEKLSSNDNKIIVAILGLIYVDIKVARMLAIRGTLAIVLNLYHDVDYIKNYLEGKSGKLSEYRTATVEELRGEINKYAPNFWPEIIMLIFVHVICLFVLFS